MEMDTVENFEKNERDLDYAKDYLADATHYLFEAGSKLRDMKGLTYEAGQAHALGEVLRLLYKTVDEIREQVDDLLEDYRADEMPDELREALEE